MECSAMGTFAEIRTGKFLLFEMNTRNSAISVVVF